MPGKKQKEPNHSFFIIMEKKKLFRLLYLSSIVLTLLVGLLAIIGSFVTKVHPADSSFISFLGIILPVLIVINIFTVIYWAIRFRFWFWVSLIAVICNYGFISSIYQLPFRSNELAQHEITLKISTFNVGRFGGDNEGGNQRRIAFFMYEESVDVICIQEYKERGNMQADILKELFSAWPYVVIPKAEDGRELLQLAVYSKYPILNSKLITYNDSPNCSMWCDIDFNGKTIRVFNNHLQTTNINQVRGTYDKYYKNANSLDVDMKFVQGAGSVYHTNEIIRANQADVIKKLVQESPHPVIVSGDFNSPPSSYVYASMRGNLEDGFKTSGRGFGGTYRYFKGLLRIDYILYSTDFRGINYYSTKTDFGSDHNPIIMELDLKHT